MTLAPSVLNHLAPGATVRRFPGHSPAHRELFRGSTLSSASIPVVDFRPEETKTPAPLSESGRSPSWSFGRR